LIGGGGGGCGGCGDAGSGGGKLRKSTTLTLKVNATLGECCPVLRSKNC